MFVLTFACLFVTNITWKDTRKSQSERCIGYMRSLDTIQDFLCKLGMKPRMQL